MSGALRWSHDGADWPNRGASEFVEAAGLRWHVQRSGSGPVMLLLHGTGSATHSWSTLLPLLARHFTVIAPDLPGHGFTSARRSGILSLPWMARVTSEMLDTLGAKPDFIVGHSAGAAIAAQMVLDKRAAPRRIVSINGALLPFPGVAQHLFPALAKVLFLNSVVPTLMAWHARLDDRAVDRMIASTGSTIDDRQMRLYGRLYRSSEHVDAALAMMANWDLTALEAALPRLEVPVTLIAAEGDKFIAPGVADRAAALLPQAKVVRVPALGHLVHEEDAAAIAAIIEAEVAASGSATGSADQRAKPPRAASGREA